MVKSNAIIVQQYVNATLRFTILQVPVSTQQN